MVYFQIRNRHTDVAFIKNSNRVHTCDWEYLKWAFDLCVCVCVTDEEIYASIALCRNIISQNERMICQTNRKKRTDPSSENCKMNQKNSLVKFTETVTRKTESIRRKFKSTEKKTSTLNYF